MKILSCNRIEFFKVSSFLITFLIIFFYKPIFNKKILSPNDLIYIFPPWNSELPAGYDKPSNPILRDHVDQFYPWRNFAKEEIQKGKLPLWNPYMQSGAPMIANYQSAVFYPLSILYYTLSDSISSWLVPFIELYLAGIFTYFFIRALNLSFYPSLLSSVAYMFNANMISLILKSVVPVYIFLPGLFLCTEYLFDKKKRRKALFWLSVISGIQFTGGHPETSFNIVIFSSIYFFIRVGYLAKNDPDKKDYIRLVSQFILAHISGFLIAAIQIFPFLEYLYSSSALQYRSLHHAPKGIMEQLSFSMNLIKTIFISLNIPYFFGSPMDGVSLGEFIGPSCYIGVIPFLFFLYALLSLKTDPRIKPFFILISLSFLFILEIPFISSLLTKLPGFNLALNIMIITIISFLFCVVAGIGMDKLINNENLLDNDPIAKIWLKLITVNLLIVCGYIIIRLEDIKKMYYLKEETLNIITFLSFYIIGNILMWQLLKRKGRYPYYPLILILGTFADMFLFARYYNPSMEEGKLYPYTEEIKFLKDDRSIFRIAASGDILIPEIGMVYKLADVRAYDAMLNKRYSEFMYLVDPTTRGWLERGDFHIMINSNLTSRLYNLLNVKYILTDKELRDARYSLKFNRNNLFIYENIDLFDRAFIADRVITIPGDRDILKTLSDPSFDLHDTVILEKNIDTLKDREDGTLKNVSIKKYEPDYILMEAELDSSGMLVLLDNYYPGWKAYIDGVQSDILRVDYTFRGLFLNKGKHKIEYIYDPISSKAGLYVSVLTLFIVCCIYLRRRRV